MPHSSLWEQYAPGRGNGRQREWEIFCGGFGFCFDRFGGGSSIPANIPVLICRRRAHWRFVTRRGSLLAWLIRLPISCASPSPAASRRYLTNPSPALLHDWGLRCSYCSGTCTKLEPKPPNWSGAKSATGTQKITVNKSGNLDYTLTCPGTGDSSTNDAGDRVAILTRLVGRLTALRKSSSKSFHSCGWLYIRHLPFSRC